LRVDALDAVQHGVLANRAAVLARAEDFLESACSTHSSASDRRNPPGRCSLPRLSTTKALPTRPASSRVRGAASLFSTFGLRALHRSPGPDHGTVHSGVADLANLAADAPQNAVLKVHMAAQGPFCRPITASPRAPAQSSGIETPHIIFSTHPFMAQKGQMPCALRLA
jgi:hypothetical protein